MPNQNLIIRQTENHSVNFYGIHLPKGAVYCVLPARTYKGEFQSKAYAWVENLMLARNNRHFAVRMLTVNDRQPRTIYMDGNKGFANSLRNFIRTLPVENLSVVRGATRREIRAIGAPRDREVGRYIQRGRPSFDTAPNVMTENSVTAGVRIGPVWLTEEGYANRKMGVSTPDFNRGKYIPEKKTAIGDGSYAAYAAWLEERRKAHDAESLSLDVPFNA